MTQESQTAAQRRDRTPSCGRSPPATRSRAPACCRCSTSCRPSRAGSRREGIEACADILDITAAEVSGVATFYTMYKRRPVGDYHVGVCTNTLCAVMGGDAIFERLKEHLDVGNDETTDDGKITLEHVECNAACDYAPVMMVNWEFMDNMTPESATQLVDDLREGTEVRSTRGPADRAPGARPSGCSPASPTTWPTRARPPGPASLVGLEIAREHGWTAPTARERHEQRPTPGDGRSPRRSTSARASPRTTRTEESMADTLTPVLTDDWDDDRPGRSRPTRRAAATARCGQALAHGARRHHHRGQGLRAARPRRRRLPDRHEVGLHPAGQPEPEVPRRQRRRVRAGHLQGHPADDGEPAHARRGRDHQQPTPSAPTRRSSTSAARSLHVVRRLQRAVAGGLPAGHLGKDIHGSGYDLDLVVHAGAGAYICGEETALLDSLEGRRGQPRLRPPFPAVAGLYASPTVINNVESIASVPEHHRQRRRLVRLDGHREVQGLRHLLAVGPRRAAPASTKRRSASRCAS